MTATIYATPGGNLIRATLLTLVRDKKLGQRECEVMFTELAALERQAADGRVASQLAGAALGPVAPVAPTFQPPARGNTAQRHDTYSTEGKPPAQEPAAVTRNNAECRKTGWVNGKFVPLP
jgi:hypothetical protein